MTFPIAPAAHDIADLEVVSRCLTHWRGDDLALSTVDGKPGTFSRGATASLVDRNGVSFTAANQQPRWEPRDWLGTGPRTHMGLLLGTADRLTFAADWLPMPVAFWVEFIEAGTVAASGSGVLAVANAAVSGARLVVDSTGTYYRVRHHNGSAEVTATLGVAPVSGDRVVLRGQLYADGSVQLWQSVNGAAETSTTRTSGNTLAAAWGSSPLLWVNSVGNANAGTAWLRRIRLVAGLPDYALLSRVF